VPEVGGAHLSMSEPTSSKRRKLFEIIALFLLLELLTPVLVPAVAFIVPLFFPNTSTPVPAFVLAHPVGTVHALVEVAKGLLRLARAGGRRDRRRQQ